MFKNKKIVLFLLVLPLVAVLVAPKVALADDDSDWVKNIPIIGGVVDFASDPGGWITDRFAEGAEFFFNDGLQNIKTTSTKSILGKSFNNLLGKKTGTFYSTVSFVNKSVVMPTAASILSLVMLIQLIKISQRIDGTATLPAIKDIVFLIIYATIFIWLLKNSLKICAGAYDLFNEMIGKINQSTVDELKTVTIADSCKESFGAVIGIWVQSMILAVNETTISLMAKVPSSVFLDAVACMDSRYMSGHTVDTGHAFIVSPGTYEPYIGIHDPVYGAGYMMVDLDKPFEIPMNRIWIAMDDYSGPETKEGLRGMYHSPQDVSAFSDPFCGSVSVTPTRDEKQEPAKSGLEAKRDACAISAAHLDSPNTEIPDGKNMERE